MEIISRWSEIDSLLTSTLVTALGGKAEPAIAMLSALTSSQAQLAALQAGIATVLAGERKAIFEAAIILIKKAQKHRHILAHWLWAYSDTLPNDVILTNPKSDASYHVKLRNSIIDDDKIDKSMEALIEGSWVYGLNDFHELLEEAKELGAVALDLLILCWGETSPQAEKAHHRLLNVPGVQRQIARGTRGLSPNPKPQS